MAASGGRYPMKDATADWLPSCANSSSVQPKVMQVRATAVAMASN